MAFDTPLSSVPGIDAVLTDPFAGLAHTMDSLQVNSLGQLLGQDSGGPLGGASFGGSGGSPFDFKPVQADGTYPGATGGAAPYMPTGSSGYSGGSSAPAGPGVVDSGGGGSTGGGGTFTSEQTQNANIIAQVGRRLGATQQDIQTAIAVGLEESGLRNLNYGDKSSLGIFQQQDWWGTSAQRTDPAQAAKLFFTGGADGSPGLLDIKNRSKMTIGQAGAAVQKGPPASAYDNFAGDAGAILHQASGGSSGSGSDTQWVGNYRPNKLMTKAQSFVNSAGSSWYRMCEKAVEQASGGTGPKYASAGAAWNGFLQSGAAHPANGQDGNQPPVGAWLYYGASSPEGHVALYLGNGKVLSTDVFGQGTVGIGDMNQLTNGAWHLQYLGWAAPWGQGSPKQLPSDRTKPPSRSAIRDLTGGSTSGPGGTPAPTAAGVSDQLRQQVVGTALKLVGTPFQWGGETPTGLGPGGLLKLAYGSAGVVVPSHPYAQATMADHSIGVAQASPGDLVVWANPDTHALDGLGLYMGNNLVIHATQPGAPVQISQLGDHHPNAYALPMDAFAFHDYVPYQAPVTHYTGGYVPAEPTGGGGVYHPPAVPYQPPVQHHTGGYVPNDPSGGGGTYHPPKHPNPVEHTFGGHDIPLA